MNLESLRGVVTTGTGGPDGLSRELEASDGNLRVANWLFRSKAASIIWLVARLWLGYEWLNAGYRRSGAARARRSGTGVGRP
jgi:hypothetical protein